MTGFFEEVKRRKVYRVAAAYVIAAGGIIQLASATFPAWELPNWSLRLVILLLLVGFPIALILAWAFDITPQGIQATPDTTAPRTRRRRNRRFLFHRSDFQMAGRRLTYRPCARRHEAREKSLWPRK